MTSKILLVFSLFVLTGCGTVQRQPLAPVGPPIVRAPSVYGLLGERERLELTSEQVESLDSIGRWLASETARIREELEPVRRAGRAQPDSAEFATLNEAITAVHVQAIESVGDVLTEQQRETVCALQRQDRDRDQDAQARDARARRGLSPGVIARARWTWCEDEQPTPPAADLTAAAAHGLRSSGPGAAT